MCRLTPALLRAVVMEESNGNPLAIGPMTRFGTAKGLMQVLDSTGEEWCKRLRLGEWDWSNPEQNVAVGACYLQSLLTKYDSVPLGCTAYNWGTTNLDKLLDAGDSWDDWDVLENLVPSTTKNYVNRILSRVQHPERWGGGDPALNEYVSGQVANYFQKFVKTSEGGILMLDWVKQLVAGQMARSVIRKLLTLAAGFLLGIGLDPAVVNQFSSSTEQVLIAVALYAIAQGWSILEKKALSGQVAK